MNSIINTYLVTLEFDRVQHFENMTVFPILSPVEESIHYITLNSALEKNHIKVTEINDSGSVPELRVINEGDIPVFLLDGEELAGAKQNRVINASILLKENSETIIPVSCSEQGRWSYTSDEFYDSGIVMSRNIRAKKAVSVAESLRVQKTFDSDQQDIWDDIKGMSIKENVHSHTDSMRDVYESKTRDLDDYMKAFPGIEGQKGILVLINNKVVGFDSISLLSAYIELHTKLIKSYAMDALLQRPKSKSNGNGLPSYDKALIFLEKAKKCTEKKYASVGYGWDYRFDGDKVIGSALLHEEEVIHMSFFSANNSDKGERISSLSSRRNFRYDL